MNGAYVVIGVLALATAFGLWRRHTDGRVRLVVPAEPTASSEQSVAEGVAAEQAPASPFADFGELGERATIVQFSARVCAPCRAAKVIASDIVATVPGVTHIEIDAESHMDLVQEHGIMRTPTLLVLDGQGRLSARIAGVPRKDELLIALDDRRFENL